MDLHGLVIVSLRENQSVCQLPRLLGSVPKRSVHLSRLAARVGSDQPPLCIHMPMADG